MTERWFSSSASFGDSAISGQVFLEAASGDVETRSSNAERVDNYRGNQDDQDNHDDGED
jgi:hypothetical protein